MSTLPRLTGALRAFSNVSIPVDNENTVDIAAKRRQQTSEVSNDGVVWDQVVAAVKKYHNCNDPDVTKTIQELTKFTRAIVGQDSDKEMVEGALGLMVDIFHKSRNVGKAEATRIRKMFGPFPHSAAHQVFTLVRKITSWLPDHIVESISAQSRGSGDGLESTNEFGSKIHFTPAAILEDDLSNSDLEDDDSDDLKSRVAEPKVTLSSIDMSVFRNSVRKPKNTVTKIDATWLFRQVSQQFNASDLGMGLTIEDLSSSVFNLLASTKSDDELQNELFELLGFDRFEFIQILLEQRKHLVIPVSNGRPTKELSKLHPVGDDEDTNRRCPTVTIQSEEEKRLVKKFRKEERRLNKQLEDAEEKAGGMDIQALRTQRSSALNAAFLAGPSLAKSTVTPSTREKYPYVFDLLAEVKQNSAFIGGTKMLLPVGTETTVSKTHDEVNIPPNLGAPDNVKYKPVVVDQLDEIAQVAFKGIKKLNRIQSIVFDTAYRTSENLLICAPTGAGKTNIAMLTILNEIRQHVCDGVIRTDDFKIIYIAPMKALAAEMVRNFSERLHPLGVNVKELTGDMSLTKKEIMMTQMLVTTPEKWDVVTRKGTGDVALTQIVRLLIIDEVHLLHDDRGSVIESLVARTLRQVESTQSMIRIIGLSATLPNYIDVAQFLRVNPHKGLFFFDGRFRPVPLGQTFVGIKAIQRMKQLEDMNSVCYEKVLQQVSKNYQVMVFVHARNETVRTAMVLREMAKTQGHIMKFVNQNSNEFGQAQKTMMNSRNKELRELFQDGFAIHHAGMLRHDRNLVEKYFSAGLIKVLVCTSTLAWGVNLPAHAVIIKGTQIYDAKHGMFIDLSILDVMQIFGRAGRPQYDTFGHGTIITSYDKLSHYLALMTRQNPIESRFVASLADNLNAEIGLGTVTNVTEAVQWLSYTYLFVRMNRNPLVYGIMYDMLQEDPLLTNHREALIVNAARRLDKAMMIRYDDVNGYLHATDMGRTASHYYIKCDTIEVFNEQFTQVMSDAHVFDVVAMATEFEQIKVREEEMDELTYHLEETCHLPVKGGVENCNGKVNVLLQSYLSRHAINAFSLVSDMAYVAQNAARIFRALFEIALHKHWPLMTSRLLQLSKTIDKRLWGWEHPLRQIPSINAEVLQKLESFNLTVDKLREMKAEEIGHMIRHVSYGSNVKKHVHEIPAVQLDAEIQPITRSVLRVRLNIRPDFRWNDHTHGKSAEPFWIWVEDPDNDYMYHSEHFLMHKKQVVTKEEQQLVFTIPIFEPLPSQYYVKVVSDRWLGSEAVCAISFQHLILPEHHLPHTELLDLQPLPVSALQDASLSALYSFTHFNPIQTQVFHTVYHTDGNVLLGAPTGSGKTVAAEMAIFRVFRDHPGCKAVYIAPLKALVRERMIDWNIRIAKKLGKKHGRVVELTGDVTPDMRAIATADLIVTTPEKWDGVSRSWQTRAYVKDVVLLVIDEIHLLGNDRGPVLEVIVSRTNFISSHTTRPVRIVGLSTALANARDLADWLGIGQAGLFNFRPSVRPVPLAVHISGFPGKHYCPRMATMNKPAFQGIKLHSPDKPVLIFVSSRRQTRLTALDLIAFLAADDNPKQWLHTEEHEMMNIIEGVRDSNLRLTLAFGIGLHHAGLVERDRKVTEELFVNQKIQILVATSTLAWGVNFPAHLVIVKGTEYFDGKTGRYADFPITDVLQMMGRAGRPQFDDHGVALIFVHDIKKHFYKKFLYEPFPVESNLLEVLPDHLNAEIVAGTISSTQDAMDYITWTYFFRRLLINPTYYTLEKVDHESINKFLSGLVQRSIATLQNSYCVMLHEDELRISAETSGRIASYYYLTHKTVRLFQDSLTAQTCIPDIIDLLSKAHEYAELPVRHNEDQLNSELAKQVPLEVEQHSFDSAHTKANILLQCHFSRGQLPSSDYFTDTKSVLDQSIRILQAMLDIAADHGWLATSLQIILTIQMVIQGRWSNESSLLTLPHVMPYHVDALSQPSKAALKLGCPARPIECLPELIGACHGGFNMLHALLQTHMEPAHIEQVHSVLSHLPIIEVSLFLKGWWSDSTNEEDLRPISVDDRGVLGEWLNVHADQEYTLHVCLNRLNRRTKNDSKAHAPHFPKPKDEGWVLVLGEVETREVIALKRVGCVCHTHTSHVAFYTPETVGRCAYTLYLMSDSYLGLDQQYEVRLNVTQPDIAAQLNTELTDIDFEIKS